MKKKVDPRIRQMLEDAVRNNHRAMMLLVGDKSRDQVVNLHYMLSKLLVTTRPSVLWCYKKELGFSASKKKRLKVMKKRMKQGLIDANKDDPFELFISSTSIRFAYYSETHKILGNTYGMCILQDFEALTPNLLARTLETVQGGGLIVVLVHSMPSLRTLFSLAMDSHARLRTEAHSTVVPRFNERFILSFADCASAIVADDELNVLPLSSRVRALAGHVNIERGALGKPGSSTAEAPELKELKKSLEEALPVGPLVAKARTIDQARAILRFEEALSEKTLRTTVALTASRGRGKSAALGLAVAAAIAHEYSNIFVTSPSPENLRTFFAFLFVGFDALGMQEHADYEIIQSTTGINGTSGGGAVAGIGGADKQPHASKDAVVRVNVFKTHRQTIQYIDPTDAHRFLSQAELLIIDEAAAIPLPLVDAMLGPYVVFMASTVTGYEGTGRSLSLKLLKKLRDNNVLGANNSIAGSAGASSLSRSNTDTSAKASSAGRVFHEVHMETPIRYAEKDPVEAWLYDLLCLRAGGTRQVLTGGAPHPSECELFYVERDALFSRHRASEAFLQRVVALFVSSHYKNSPNDLQMLSDAPAHALFVLLAPTPPDATALPDVLVAIQVCLEGRISQRSSRNGLARGTRASGDLIPWTVAQQFQEPDFASLSGARIVRVATHPDLQGMGYGTRAVQLLMEFYAGKFISLDDNVDNDKKNDGDEENDEENENNSGKTLLNEIIGPRKNIPPLLRRLHERTPERLDYIGVSFGLTDGLYNFWGGKLGFLPMYVRLTPNDLTGEHTCIMASCAVSELSPSQAKKSDEVFSSSWLPRFHDDFRRRLVYLLGFELRKFSPKLATAMLDQRPNIEENEENQYEKASLLRKGRRDVKSALHAYDLRRLESYAKNLVDFHMILDIVPRLAELFVLGAFNDDLDISSGIAVSSAQKAILVAVGLQRKSVDDVAADLSIQVNQVLALLNKVIRKFAKAVRDREEAEVEQEIGARSAYILKRLPAKNQTNGSRMDDDEADEVEEENEDEKDNNTDEDMDETAKENKKDVGSGLEQFKIKGSDRDWNEALTGKKIGHDGSVSGVVSIKASKETKETDVAKQKGGESKREREKGGRKRKKRKMSQA